MIIERIPAGVYAVNCYVIGCEKTGKAAIIDPGGDAQDILRYIEKSQLELELILLTHGHGDHIGGVMDIKEKIDVPVLIHKDDAYMVEDAEKNLSSLMSGPDISFIPDKLVKDGDIISLGNLKLYIIHTPGHTAGSISIRVEEALFSGDTLFANSIGRTDLEGGCFDNIIESIKRKLLALNDETRVFPGHGPATTIGIERITNPFLHQ